MTDSEMLAVLLEHVVEWTPERDMQASYVYCRGCGARCGPDWTWSYNPPKHDPGCKLGAAIALARERLAEEAKGG